MIRSEKTVILVDAGISGKRTREGLKSVGTAPEEVDALLITHEHSDHVKSLRIVRKQMPQLISYSNFETWEAVRDIVGEERHVTFDSGERFMIGDIEVRSFATHHDSAGAVSYSFVHDGKQISILTDTGYVCDRIFDEIKDSDLIALEANHDVNVLQMGRYPYYVKRRILGDGGHLSNEAAADCIARMIREGSADSPQKKRTVLLAHLSKENNSPDMALLTVKNKLSEDGIEATPIGAGSDLEVGVITRDEVSPLFEVGT